MRGNWLVRAKDIEGMNAQQIQQYLALPTVPNRIVDVTIPAGTNMRVGQIAEQPSFGATGKTGTQYQLLDKIEDANYINSRELK
jgi:hypothetical protein